MVNLEFEDLENVSGGIPVAVALVLASPAVRALAVEMAVAAIGGLVAGAYDALN